MKRTAAAFALFSVALSPSPILAQTIDTIAGNTSAAAQSSCGHKK